MITASVWWKMTWEASSARPQKLTIHLNINFTHFSWHYLWLVEAGFCWTITYTCFFLQSKTASVIMFFVIETHMTVSNQKYRVNLTHMRKNKSVCFCSIQWIRSRFCYAYGLHICLCAGSTEQISHVWNAAVISCNRSVPPPDAVDLCITFNIRVTRQILFGMLH